MQELKVYRMGGTPEAIGRQLGELAKPVFETYMAQSSAWQAVSRWRGHAFVQELRAAAQQYFPAQVAELDAMASALGWSAHDLFLWNCRGELIHNAPDGCTTLASATPAAGLIAHNEDGDPYLRGRCHMVEVEPAGQPGYVSFYYPGSLPGHTFAASRAGVAQAINNVRIREPRAGVPRMILARAVLDAASLDDALALLRDTPRASGFHHTLGGTDAAGAVRVFSVEATAQRASVVEVSAPSGHANHLIHAGCEHEAQIVTDSSRDRQARLADLLPALVAKSGAHPQDEAFVQTLHDRAGSGLPIFRDDPHDPDDENTLATACMRIDARGVTLDVWQDGARVMSQPIARG
ncbi:Acyl-CoA:6-aminopenicillanic acid acyl transferase [Paraburkholderia tropica]|uniref:C45 family autoproteolytic acyltransferase/hydolase n=1 Tax=Paraburkholderia tropica TaxID=92647 RepID=UPI001CAC1B8B|nr:C45 family peptidase [Paraburkholderia tropica]CAG9234535.1 Acyl-CoA:6-aminopenicillanic acid acyl transferase [Paraburkholderia tropica]